MRDVDVRDRALGALLGLAIGDALGAQVEFHPRGSFKTQRDLVGGGPHGLPAGAWTDDTSMAIALGMSLVDHGGELVSADVLERWSAWLHDGAYSSVGTCFDVGCTTREALLRWARQRQPSGGTNPGTDAGNGSIMRLAPVAIVGVGRGEKWMVDAARRSSALTHDVPEARDGCALLAVRLRRLITGDIAWPGRSPWEQLSDAPLAGGIEALRQLGWMWQAWADLKGSGYVVDTLEAALWCSTFASGFEEALTWAIDLGGDTDTVGAVTGQLAGARWGLRGIPARWLERVYWRDDLINLAELLLGAGFAAA